MRFIGLNDDLYFEIEDYMLKFKKMNVFKLYNDRFFFIKYNNKNYLLSCSCDLGKKNPGFLLFNSDKSIKRLTDFVQTYSENKSLFNDFLSVSLFSKSKLSPFQESFIYERGLEDRKKHVIVEKHSFGYTDHSASSKDAKEIISCFKLLLDLFVHHADEIECDFDSIIVIGYNSRNNKGKFYVTDEMPLVEYEEIQNDVNEEFINEVKNFKQNYYDSYFSLDELLFNCKVKECNIPFYPMFFSYYIKEEKYDFELSFTLPSYLSDVSFSALKEFFNVFGIPQKIYINNLDLYNIVYKTLSALNIDVLFKTKIPEVVSFTNTVLMGIFVKMIPLEQYEYIDASDSLLYDVKNMLKNDLAPQVVHDMLEHSIEETDEVENTPVS